MLAWSLGQLHLNAHYGINYNRKKVEPGMMAHTSNPSPLEVEAGGLCPRTTWTAVVVRKHPGKKQLRG